MSKTVFSHIAKRAITLSHSRVIRITVLVVLFVRTQGWTIAADQSYVSAEPQKSGWPLTDEERAYVLKPEYERRPGREVMKHLPELWPVVPQAGFWTGTAWLDTHAKLVEHVKRNKGPVDILLIGDSITQQWGSPLDGKPLNEGWKKHLGRYSAVNLGIGGDKTQNVLWRLDHGGVDGLKPKCIVLMIGNNNMFFTPETGVEPAARGVKACVDNLRSKFSTLPVVVVKILPAHVPGSAFYEDIKKTNAALDLLNFGSQPGITVMDLTSDFTNTDGRLNKELFAPDNVHLSGAGYDRYAERLKPVLDALVAGKPVPSRSDSR
jgi:platelet-activating factor acetylhydrolase IB subunit beta/gamma